MVNSKLFLSFLMAALFAQLAIAQEKDKTVESVVEVSIIGNSELPRVTFDLPWRLPSIENRDSQSPSEEIPSLLLPIDPERHKKQVYFSRYLEVDLPEFKTR